MPQPNASLEKLDMMLEHCRKTDFSAISKLLFVHEAPEKAQIHGMPRLSVLFQGCENFRIFASSKIMEYTMEAPSIYYCTRNGYLWGTDPKGGSPHIALSFCYLPEYIRLSWVNTIDPVVPEQWNLNIHTQKPLSKGGTALINAFENLYIQGNVDIARKTLDNLWEVTIEELSKTDIYPLVRSPRLWNEINLFLRNKRNIAVTRTETARTFGISPGYLSRLSRRHAGCDFVELATRYRLEHAAFLLQNSSLSINEISYECGFNYRSYFDRRFKLQYGITPKDFRDNN